MLRETEQDQIQISKDLQLAFNYFSKGQYRSTRDSKLSQADEIEFNRILILCSSIGFSISRRNSLRQLHPR